MTIIEAASVNARTMVDGTLRLTFDVEPRYAQAAFALFGAPGTPSALAALKPARADDETPAEPPKAATAEPERAARPKLVLDAVLVCKEPAFQEYARIAGNSATEEGAARLMRDFCSIESRRELDTDPKAAARFARLMTGYRDWLKQQPASRRAREAET